MSSSLKSVPQLLRLLFTACAAVLFATPAVTAASATQSSEVPEIRLKRLSQGINLSHWYAQSRHGYGEDHLSTYFTARDADLVAEMGFTHVRLTLNDTVLFDPSAPGRLNAEALARFDERLAWFPERGVAVIVDLHPEDDFKRTLREEEGVQAMAAYWGALASHLHSTTDPDWVFLEILNEPHTIEDAAAWRNIQGRTLAAIREAAPNHTIIATGSHWGGLDNLLALAPYDDPNLVYTFHWYDPFLFTHQAATWGWDATRHISGLGWPLAPESADATAAAVTTQKEAAEHVRNAIASSHFTKARIEEQFARLVEWSDRHGGLPIYVGEFGVFRPAAPRDARLAWHRAVREALESRGWGWAIWDYAAGFGVVTGPPTERVADSELLTALGLWE
ncbi:MAG: hypothetical protein EA425_11475 [Puniceicoccaceae bacterium]|nr:MAG: hypothetical protein EA425_11475 [Puniceicoccaceae bacterium]